MINSQSYHAMLYSFMIIIMLSLLGTRPQTFLKALFLINRLYLIFLLHPNLIEVRENCHPLTDGGGGGMACMVPPRRIPPENIMPKVLLALSKTHKEYLFPKGEGPPDASFNLDLNKTQTSLSSKVSTNTRKDEKYNITPFKPAKVPQGVQDRNRNKTCEKENLFDAN